MPWRRPPLPGQVHPGQVGPVRQVFDRPGGHAGPRPDQQMGPGPGIRAPQGDSGEAPVHDHEHSCGRGSEPDRQLRFAAAEPVHGRVEMRVGSSFGQRHHPHLGEPGHLTACVLRPAEPPPVRCRLRSVQDESVHGGEPHPTVEGSLQASRGQRPGQLAEDSLDGLCSQALASPGERGLVRDALAQPRDAAHHVLCHVVVGVLLEQGQGEREVDHEPSRERAGFLVPDAAVVKRLCGKPRSHPPGHRPQPHMIRQAHPGMHAESNDRTTTSSP